MLFKVLRLNYPKQSVFYFLSEFTGTHADGRIANTGIWGPGYEISFEFYLNSDGGTSDYQWLLGVRGTGGLGKKAGPKFAGYGQPAVFYKEGKLPMWFKLDGDIKESLPLKKKNMENSIIGGGSEMQIP